MPRTFDAIVIGSGLGGLTAGALYARAGRKVLVLERNRDFGGAATVYQHGALAIEASLHEIDGLDSEDPKTPILRSLCLDKDITFVDVGDLMEVRSPVLGKPFILPHGFEAALAAAKRRFPHQTAGLDEYFARIVAVRHAVVMMSAHQHDVSWWLWHAPDLPSGLWPLLRDRHALLGEVLQRLFGDDEAIKLALASNISYYTDNPDTMPFLSFAIAQASYLLGGGHYVRGGSRALTDRLVAIVREAGGEAEPGREVFEIILADDHVCGVGHRARGGDDSCEELAPIAFGNAAPSALAEMLPAQIRPKFTEPYRERHPSISLWTISVGLNRRSHEFGVRSYSTAILPDWQTALNDFRDGATLLGDDPGTRMAPYVLVAYDQIDSGLNENGPYLASMVGIDRLDNWVTTDIDAKRRRKTRWMDRVIADLDIQFPGIGSAVVQREMATAETLQHYLNTPSGAVYGFAPQIDHFGPAPKTAIAGLYLASAFTGGGGYTGAILGGGSAARAALAVTKELAIVHAESLTSAR
jgi:all-trans-retinol 13,14-reductase